MEKNFVLKWFILNATGFSIGFLCYLQIVMFYTYAMDFKMHWDFDADLTLSQNEKASQMYFGIPLGLAFFGLLFSSFQALLLKKYLQKIWIWILNGIIGFLLISPVIWLFGDTWGIVPGPVEPIVIMLGVLTLTSILQWWFLKRNNINGTRPLIMFIVGVILGIALLFPIFYFILGETSWPVEVLVMSLVVGSMAGLLSAKPLKKVLESKV